MRPAAFGVLLVCLVTAPLTALLGVNLFSIVSKAEQAHDIAGTNRVLQAFPASEQGGIAIALRSGTTMEAGEYEISITLGAASTPRFVPCDWTMEAGGRIVALTQSTAAWCDGAFLYGDEQVIDSGSEYRVVVRSVVGATLLDKVVEAA